MTTTTRATKSSQQSPLTSGQTLRVVRWRQRLSFRYSPRAMGVTAAIFAALLCFMLVDLSAGATWISPSEVLTTLSGNGSPGQEFILYTLRMPQVLTGALVGIALGLSGALFQSLTRNPLGSPDIIGFTQGASLAAVITLLLLNGSQSETAISALVGGFVIAVIVYVLSYRQGVEGYRLILVGVGISAILMSLVWYVLLTARVEEAQAAFVWLTGSLHLRGWEHVIPLSIALAVLVPATLAMSRTLRILEMGDEKASGLGIRVERSRLLLLFLGTGLCAVAVSAAGPIGFVALAAPQIAKRLSGTATIGLIPAAAMGGLLLVASDVAAQQALGATQLPVGVATVTLGGLYLIWLLWRENRSDRA